MIAKLMSRKKSYERMMKVDDGMQSRTPNMLHPELTQKKNQEVLLTANRGQGGGLSRANGGNSSSTRKQLQYYDSTPQREQAPRKHAGTVLKKQLITSSNNNPGGAN